MNTAATRIAVAYLATPGGDDALAVGAQIARSLGAHLDLCMVLPLDRPILAPLPQQERQDILSQNAAHWLNHAEATVPDDLSVTTHISFHESIAEGLIAQSEALGAAAIVVGGSGGGLVGSLSLGSVVNELVHSSPIPLVISPRGARYQKNLRIREVTCAMGTRPGARVLLDTALRICKRAETPLRLVSLVSIDPIPGGDDDQSARERATIHAQQSLETAKLVLPPDFPVTSTVAEGPTVEAAVNKLDWHESWWARAVWPSRDGSSSDRRPPRCSACCKCPWSSFRRKKGAIVTEDLARAELDHAERSEGLVSKGLAAGRIGTFTGAVLGISTVAPGYTLTASIGLIVAAVGLKMPAILIAGFIPMFLTAYAYRELNSRAPDCGASFTWSTKAFGPYVGWMCGWGMVIATIIVLSNLASIGVQYGYQFLGAVTHNQTVAELANNKAVSIISTVALLAIATYISSRGITTSEKVQYVLVGFQMIVLVLFAVVAIVKAPGAAGHLDFDLDWFNPMTGLTLSAFVIGLVGSIFAFWGWDTCLTLGEESKDPTKVPGRAGLLCVLSILLTYLLVAVAVMMFAGIGDTDLGLANENNKDNVFGALANPVLGSWFGPLLLLAIFASAIASLQTTSLPAARTMLAMGTYGAFPKRFASVSPRFLTPTFSTVVAGVVTAAFYTIVSLLSDRTLLDTIAALGIMICWYYGITAFACVWYFRAELFQNAHNLVYKFLFPLLGGLMLAAVFVISVQESMDPEKTGSGASIGGIGLVFYLGFGILAFGALLMGIMRWYQPAFFRGELLTMDTPPLRE